MLSQCAHAARDDAFRVDFSGVGERAVGGADVVPQTALQSGGVTRL